MKQVIFTGAGVALVTPMHADGTVNYEKLGALIDDQIAKGTDALIIAGTTGESSTLSEEEHVEVLRFAVKHTAHRVPVIAGTGSNSTATAVMLSQEAEVTIGEIACRDGAVAVSGTGTQPPVMPAVLVISASGPRGA